MKNGKLWLIATELTVQEFGPMNDHVDSEIWIKYQKGVYSGLLEMLTLVNPLLNQARSNAQRPQKPDKLREEIDNFEESIGFMKTFLTDDELSDKVIK